MAAFRDRANRRRSHGWTGARGKQRNDDNKRKITLAGL